MIETAKEQVRPNLTFRLLDVLKSHYRDQFDVVFSNATLHWIKHHKKLLTIIRRAKDWRSIARKFCRRWELF